jgi:hypothetical protein
MNLSELENLNVSIDCVVAVHMHGQMVDMPRLTIWAKSRGIKVVEDCAQAHGAQINGKFAGTWGDVGAFSFYPNKNLGAIGDAGAIVTMDQEIAETVRSYGNYGTLFGDYDVNEAGDLIATGPMIAFRGLYLIDKKGIVRHQLINDLPLGRNVDETLRMVDALQFFEENGEVCPANWTKGSEGLKDTHAGVADYLSKH